MVKDHSDSKETCCCHYLGYSSINNGFYMHHPTNRLAYTTAFGMPVVEHWLERKIAQWVHYEGSIQQPIVPRADTLP